MARHLVTLPESVGNTFDVFINGVPQVAGKDFQIEGRELVFDRDLEKEKKLGLLQWLSMFLGIAGSYGKNDTVDISYDYEGRRVVSSGLPIVPPHH